MVITTSSTTKSTCTINNKNNIIHHTNSQTQYYYYNNINIYNTHCYLLHNMSGTINNNYSQQFSDNDDFIDDQSKNFDNFPDLSMLEDWLEDELGSDHQTSVVAPNQLRGYEDGGTSNQVGAAHTENSVESEIRNRREGRERVAFKTKSEVEILEDGFKWRKYGKKMVKNSPNPRNYYRCSVEGCPVKKRVERDREDPRYVITTYEGIHNHHTSF